MVPFVPRRMKQLVRSPDLVEGELVDVDTGYKNAVIITVEDNGDIYYETYVLADVERSEAAR